MISNQLYLPSRFVPFV